MIEKKETAESFCVICKHQASIEVCVRREILIEDDKNDKRMEVNGKQITHKTEQFHLLTEGVLHLYENISVEITKQKEEIQSCDINDIDDHSQLNCVLSRLLGHVQLF